MRSAGQGGQGNGIYILNTYSVYIRMRAPEKIRPSVLYIGPDRVWGTMAWDIPYDISHNESSGIRLSV